jgi:hypothetical protein
MKVAPVAFPSAIALPIPPVTIATSRDAFCHGVIAVTFSSILGATGRATGGGVGLGAGGRIRPW